jgi:ParB-like chromosome segregation protein Spo0J
MNATSPNSETTPMNSHTSEIVITHQKIGELRSNSRTHSKRQIRQIADSIKAFGFTNSVLLDSGNTIIAGHGRVRAAELLGTSEVPTIRLKNLSADQVRAYVIADNRLAEKAGWDKSILAIELQNLLTINTDFDVTITGFEMRRNRPHPVYGSRQPRSRRRRLRDRPDSRPSHSTW